MGLLLFTGLGWSNKVNCLQSSCWHRRSFCFMITLVVVFRRFFVQSLLHRALVKARGIYVFNWRWGFGARLSVGWAIRFAVGLHELYIANGCAVCLIESTSFQLSIHFHFGIGLGAY